MFRKVVITLLLMAAMMLGACKNAYVEPALVINEKVFSYDEVSYLIIAAIRFHDMFDVYPLDWEGTVNGVSTAEYIKRQAIDMAVSAYIIEARCEEMGLYLTEDDISNIEWEMALEHSANKGKEAAETLDLYRYYNYTIPALNEKLQRALFGTDGDPPEDEEVERFYRNNYTNVAYIFISSVGEDGIPLEGAELNTQRLVSESLCARALNGEDFYMLVAEHGQDYAMSSMPEGLPVAAGAMGSEFDQALSGLEIDGISDVVVCRYGFYIIKRLGENMGYLYENFDAVRENYISQQYLEMFDGWINETEIEIKDVFERIEPRDFAE